MELLDREREMRWILSRFEKRTSGPLVVVVRGEPGIGKSSLWRAAVSELGGRSWAVLKCRPTDSVIRLSFSALGDLLDGLDAITLQALPAPQQRAIESMLKRIDPEDSLLPWQGIHYALVRVLRHLSTKAPLLLAIDDLQSLDASSEQALVTALRCLEDEPVAMLATIRSSRGEKKTLELTRAVGQDGFAVLDLGPLSLEATGEIIENQLDLVLPHPLQVQVWRASGGNPFLALEIARVLDRPHADPGNAGGLPIPTGLEEVVGAPLDILSDAASKVLLVASALSRPTTRLIHAALDSAVASRGLAEAEARGILEVSNVGVSFSHPLLASAVYARSTADQRSRMHRRLADLVDDAEERTRHLALGIDVPDEQVAGALEEAAVAAYRRGAVRGAAELCDLAVSRTPPELEKEKQRRSLDSAMYQLESGDADKARRTLESTIAGLDSGPLRTEALNRLAHVQFHDKDWPSAAAFCEAALAEPGLHPMATLATLQHLTQILVALEDAQGALNRGRSALQLAHELGIDAITRQSQLVVATTEFMHGLGLDARLMVEMQGDDRWIEKIPAYIQPTVMYAVLLQWSDRFDEASERLRFLHRKALDYGNDTAIAHILFHICELEIWSGDLDNAVRDGRESYRVAKRAGHVSTLSFHTYVWALAEAHLGRMDTARNLAGEGLQAALQSRAASCVTLNTAVLGFIELSLGRPLLAHEHLGPITERLISRQFIEPALFHILPNEIEALIGCGRLDQAEAQIEFFEQRARVLKRISAIGAAARCRALLRAAKGQLSGAIDEFHVALESYDKLTQHFERARTLLWLGVTQRRAKQWASARATLQESLDVFERIGGAVWAEKARAEMGRLGASSGDDKLTPTERRVAKLVSSGMSNQETALALHLSVRTVESNLTRIYRKLGLRSRAQLAGHFAQSSSTPTSPSTQVNGW
jgi:DNA-binding CsgD family transcriptional regulator